MKSIFVSGASASQLGDALSEFRRDMALKGRKVDLEATPVLRVTDAGHADGWRVTVKGSLWVALLGAILPVLLRFLLERLISHGASVEAE